MMDDERLIEIRKQYDELNKPGALDEAKQEVMDAASELFDVTVMLAAQYNKDVGDLLKEVDNLKAELANFRGQSAYERLPDNPNRSQMIRDWYTGCPKQETD